jgi:GH24 family phage-related lysozyme (muramidase)
MRRLVYAAMILSLLAVPSSSQEKKRKREPDPLMVAKLKESQTLLEGLTLNDMAKVQKSAEELLRISKTAQMRKALNTPAYELHANSFQKAAETVVEKAKAKNIDGATLGYMDMTITCVRCHQYTREQGIGLSRPKERDGIGE